MGYITRVNRRKSVFYFSLFLRSVMYVPHKATTTRKFDFYSSSRFDWLLGYFSLSLLSGPFFIFEKQVFFVVVKPIELHREVGVKCCLVHRTTSLTTTQWHTYYYTTQVESASHWYGRGLYRPWPARPCFVQLFLLFAGLEWWIVWY